MAHGTVCRGKEEEEEEKNKKQLQGWCGQERKGKDKDEVLTFTIK